MRINIDRRLDAAIAAFVSDIRELARRGALEAVAGAFADTGAPPTTRSAQERLAARAPGAKRTPRELASEVKRLERHIADNPGQRIEEIARALGVATRELQLPARKLLAGGRVRTEGQKRATRYFSS